MSSLSKAMQVASMSSPILLGLGLVFSVATQLRVSGIPFGVGEFLLLLWLLSTFAASSNWRDPVLIGVLSFALIGTVMLVAGYFLTSYPAGHSRPPALHDALAYAFCAVLAINYARLADRYENSLPAVLLWAFLFSALVALMFGVIGSEWSGIDAVWRAPPYRWKHLSSNPNQFALLALPLPFLALHLALRQHSTHNLVLAFLAGFLALTLGWHCQSDALTLSWAGSGLILLLALFANRRKKSSLRRPVAKSLSFALPSAAVFVVIMIAVSAWQWRDKVPGVVAGISTASADLSAIVTSTQCAYGEVYNQSSLRFCLWRNGLASIQYAPLSGLGPGPHSGFTQPFDGVEAHNTLIDWGTQTGLVGTFVLLVYGVWLVRRVASQHQYELVAMLLALYCFSMFHFVLRQPLFWIIPLLALQLATRSSLNISDVDQNK